jgi:hypothetical protein
MTRGPLRRRLANNAERPAHEAHCAEMEKRREDRWAAIREEWSRANT